MEGFSEMSSWDIYLKNPDPFIGSVKSITQSLWVLENKFMVYRPITYCPGLLKIFDAILLNAAEHKSRDPSVANINVLIDVDKSLISIWNNGGISVEKFEHGHKYHNRYLPEVLFSETATSYRTKGKHGYGAKLANIFSTSFIIETADGKKKYRQEFKNNMSETCNPQVEDCESTDCWTSISFKPDLEKFGTDVLDLDTVALMQKRVIEIAACLGNSVEVKLDGQTVEVKSFEDYVKLYPGDNDSRLSLKFNNDRGEEVFVVRRLSDEDFQQVSFVNSIATVKGGTHVDLVTSQITDYITKARKGTVKPDDVKRQMFVFFNVAIANPHFDSVTLQEKLTLSQSKFESDYQLSEDFLAKVMQMLGVPTRVKENFNGFYDAKEAGTKNANLCTLILTEGNSSASFAVNALDVLPEEQRRFYGVFAFQGKVINVKKASSKKINANQVLKRLKQAIGSDAKRYGKVMIMTDQDADGFHIKGLIISLFHTLWPDLVKRSEAPFFISEFVTPMYKVTNNSNGEVLSFYSKLEYKPWFVQNKVGWTMKRYKGIASGTEEEAEEYFRNFKRHHRDFIWSDGDENAIQVAFAKRKIKERKIWLNLINVSIKPTTYLDRENKETTRYLDFINQELRLFSFQSIERNIPQVGDGFKPSQRKVFFCSLGRKPSKRINPNEYKVRDLAGRVSHKSDYHHGETSIIGTIIKMARDYVGNANINLLNRIGQFGTRRFNGEDVATAKYISTKISPLAKFIFPENDDSVLGLQIGDKGNTVEPTCYMPIIPLILVNGCSGVGYPYRTFIPKFDAQRIIENVKLKLDGKPLKPMEPSYNGFRGKIEKKSDGVYSTTGVCHVNKEESTIQITELPISPRPKISMKSLKNMKTADGRHLVEDVEDRSTSSEVNFTLKMTKENMKIAEEKGIIKTFGLETNIDYKRMVLLQSSGKIKSYNTPDEIFEDYYKLRYKLYDRRLEYIKAKMTAEIEVLEQREKFVSLLKEKKIGYGEPRNAWEKVFEQEGLQKRKGSSEERMGYEYLFEDTSVWTEEKCNQLKFKISKLKEELEVYSAKTEDMIWREEVCRLEEEIKRLDDNKSKKRKGMV